LYAGCCDHLPDAGKMITLSADAEKYIDDLIKAIFDNKDIPDTSPELIQAYGTKLGDAVVKGYGSKLSELDWNTPDYEMLTQLQNNVWQFSAAKTHTQMRDMGKALIGPDGKVRSFDDFKREAQAITGEQLKWLRTEYDSAIAGAQMAAKWVKIQAEKETFPLLEFDAVIDDHSSNICPPLNKVTLPVDHPFWLKFYPPNHFKCRSTVRQLRKGEVTPDEDIQYPEKIQPMFAGNVGIDGMIFSRDSAYYVDAPPHIINNATLYMPADEQYITKYLAEDGTAVTANRKTDIENKPDYVKLLKVGEVLAKNGKTVDILPEIHASETELRTTLLPGVADGKNPDAVVNGEYTEVKTPTEPVTFKKLQRAVANAVQQADRVVIELTEPYDEHLMKLVAEERFKTVAGLNDIGFVTVDGEYIEFKNDHGHKK
jgi:hypothetical protein